MSPGVTILLAVLVGLAGLYGLRFAMNARMRASEGKPAPPTGDLGSPEGRLLWFYGPSCAPCHAMRPAVDALGDQVIPVDVSRHLDVARAYGVMATPTTVSVRDGRIVAVRPGRLTHEALQALIHT